MKAPKVKNDDPEMRGQRSRNDDGKLRQKRGDTLIATIEEQYGVDFGRRSDMELGNLRNETGKSLSQLIKDAK